jgi:putative flippase GtrA
LVQSVAHGSPQVTPFANAINPAGARRNPPIAAQIALACAAGRDMRTTAMAQASPPDSTGGSVQNAPPSRALSQKAFVFAVIGVLNTAVDYVVFLAARAAYMHLPPALAAFASLSGLCRCGAPDTVLLIGANITSWIVAVSGSYVLNSSITFAAESGRKLRWRDYITFVVSGIVGLIANTAVLIVTAQVLLLPVWLAKALAILASFVVNFTLSHLVVFRPRGSGVVGGQGPDRA